MRHYDKGCQNVRGAGIIKKRILDLWLFKINWSLQENIMKRELGIARCGLASACVLKMQNAKVVNEMVYVTKKQA